VSLPSMLDNANGVIPAQESMSRYELNLGSFLVDSTISGFYLLGYDLRSNPTYASPGRSG